MFLLCQCVYEGVYMTRLLVDDKTFKNIRCYSRLCFPLLVYVFSFFERRILTFFFFYFIENYSSNARTRDREREFQCCYCGAFCCCCCYSSCVMLLFSPWISKKEKTRPRAKIYIMFFTYIYIYTSKNDRKNLVHIQCH